MDQSINLSDADLTKGTLIYAIMQAGGSLSVKAEVIKDHLKNFTLHLEGTKDTFIVKVKPIAKVKVKPVVNKVIQPSVQPHAMMDADERAFARRSPEESLSAMAGLMSVGSDYFSESKWWANTVR